MSDISAANTELIKKMDRLAKLNADDHAALSKLTFHPENVAANHYLVRQGDRVTRCCLLVSGFACRDKMNRKGDRQIVSFHMAGDMLDLQQALLPTADHNLRTITDVTVGWIAGETIRDLALRHPNIGEAFARDTLIDASIFREWVLNVGRRDAKTRVAHMLCEFVARRQAIGIPFDNPFSIPFTQQQIGDATGLTPVHVNRMLRALREEGVFEHSDRMLKITDWPKFKRIAEFDPTYLHQAA